MKINKMYLLENPET